MSTPVPYTEPVDRAPMARTMMQELTYLHAALVLEEAGHCDGSGEWQGADPISDTIRRLAELDLLRRYILHDEPIEAGR
jgi:hypothetical protein